MSSGQVFKEAEGSCIGTSWMRLMCLENHKCIRLIRVEGLWETGAAEAMWFDGAKT